MLDRWPNFGQWFLIFMGFHYGTCFMSPIWLLQFWGGSHIFGNLVNFPYWGPTNVRIHYAKFRCPPHDLAVVPNVCGFLICKLASCHPLASTFLRELLDFREIPSCILRTYKYWDLPYTILYPTPWPVARCPGFVLLWCEARRCWCCVVSCLSCYLW